MRSVIIKIKHAPLAYWKNGKLYYKRQEIVKIKPSNDEKAN